MPVDSSIIKQVNHILERDKIRFGRFMAQFSMFLVVSCALWFLLKLSHEYTTDIEYPVQLVNPPSGKMLIGTQPRSVSIKVKAHGYTLVRYKASSLMSPIKLAITDFYPVGSSTSNFYMLTRGTRQNIVSQVGSDIEVIGISSDSIFFQMTGVTDKEVDVQPVVRVSFAKQHMQAGDVLVLPSRIKITGPRAILDTIVSIRTKPLDAYLLSTSKTYDVDIKKVQQVSYAVNMVSLTIPVERFTEIALSVPVNLVNVPDNVVLVALPSKVMVKCNVLMDKYFTLKPTSFVVSCDYNDRDKVANGKIKLNMLQTPSYVSRVSFYPEYIDYFIRK